MMDLINYNNFNEATKKYINKVIDIYESIKDKRIRKRVEDCRGIIVYDYSDFDKKIFSLYLAGFMVKGALKEVLNLYDNIENLLSYSLIKSDEIQPLSSDKYETYYRDNFKLELSIMLQRKSKYFVIVKELTPEVIFSFLDIKTHRSKAIDYYLQTYLNCRTLDLHQSYKDIVFKAIMSKKIEINNTKIHNDNANDKSSVEPIFKMEIALDFKENSQKESLLESEKVWDILDNIKNKFIGQEQATEYLFYNIINNQHLALQNDIVDGQRSLIFFDGPTGTGKTAITREITTQLGIPYTSSSVTNYSSTGYVGGNITDTLKELYKNANGDIEQAQRGIIVFDEFDKIAYNSRGGLEMKRAVQQQLLDFMGGGFYNISSGQNLFNNSSVKFDTAKLTFICLGALSELRNHKTNYHQSIGFDNNYNNIHTSYDITPSDLISIGLERELVGRFNTYIHTEEYSRADLLMILKKSTISPMMGFIKWANVYGKKVIISENVYELIADAAYDLNIGARSLQTVMNNIRTPFIKKVLCSDEKVIYLNADNITKINNNITKRKIIR